MSTTTSKALAKAKRDLTAVRKSIRSKKAVIAKEKKKVIKRGALIKKYESQLKALLSKEKKLRTSVVTLTKKLKKEQDAAKAAASSNGPTITTGPSILTGPGITTGPIIPTGPGTTTGPTITTGPVIAIDPSAVINPGISATVFTGSSKIALTRHKNSVGAMDDRYPVLFFPVKIETKFVGNKLNVRVFPDEIFVKNLEYNLTETEREAAEKFWNSIYEIDNSNAEIEAETEEEIEEEIEAKETEKKASVNEIIDVLGKDRAAWALKQTWPTNLKTDDIFSEDKLFKLKPKRAVLQSTSSKADDWTEAAFTDMLPDRFAFHLYDDKGNVTVKKLGNTIKTDIQLGFNPTEELVKDELYQKGLKWMFDYNEAVRVGMAATISLTSEQVKDGFSKLTVVGVKYSKKISDSTTKVIELFENHQFKADGMGLVDIGKATQQVEHVDLEKEEPSELDTFIDTHLRGELGGANELKTDGSRLVEALGFNNSHLSNLQNRAKVDLSNAVEMNKILWPSTIEYYLNQFSANTYTHSRNTHAKKFFLDNVSGRGVLPTLRVGDQAYGITPVTSFSKWKNSSNPTFGEKLLESILNPLYQHVFKPKSETNISDAAEAYKALSANASSKRYSARSVIGKNLAYTLVNHQQQAALLKELKNMGIDENDVPDIMQYAMNSEATPLTGPIVDSGRVFAKRTLQTSNAHGLNIFGLLHHATSFGDIINHTFNNTVLISQKDSLLYLYVRYAYLREAVKSSLNYLEPSKLNQAVALLDSEFDHLRTNKKLSNDMVEYMRLTETSIVKSEPKFKSLMSRLNIESAKAVPMANPTDIRTVDAFLSTEVSKSVDANKNLEIPSSKWDYLNNSFTGITGTLSMGNFLFEQMHLNKPETAELKALRAALGNLKDLNVRELENLFSEHIDLTSHRLDAWLIGVANERLMNNRKKHKTGVYFGAYGFVENLKKDKKSSSDPQGYIHAPSIDQAKVSAIVRTGFSDIMKEMLKDSTTQQALSDLSIDITSKRILTSLSMIDGLNNGQDIRALLGFQFERGLSEQGLAKYILGFRDKFGTISSISSKGSEDDYKANNTVDGKALVEAYQAKSDWASEIKFESTKDENTINDVLAEIDDSLDGFSDLMHVESLYQMIKSDYSGLAALLKSLNNFERIPEPEFIKTHVHALKHENRVAVMFSANGNRSVWGNFTYKSVLNPWINEWIGNLLPSPESILVHVKGSIETTDNSIIPIDESLSFAELMSIEPIDFCASIPTDNASMHAFIEPLAKLAIADREIKISKWNDFNLDLKTIPKIGVDQYSLFEVSFIVQQARNILKNGRSLLPKDLANNTEKDTWDNSSLSALTTATRNLESQIEIMQTKLERIQTLAGRLTGDEQWNFPILYYRLFKDLLTASASCNLNGVPSLDPIYSKENNKVLLEFVEALSTQTKNLISSIKKELENMETPASLSEVKRIVSMMTIHGEYVTIPFKLKSTSEMAKTYTSQKFDNITADFNTSDWLYTASKVKETLTPLMLLDQVSIGAKPVLNLSEVKQLPYVASEANVWMGTQYKGDMDQSRISFVITSSEIAVKMSGNLSGILVADWDEQIPIKEVDTGVAFNYDAPNAKSPKNILLGVSPDVTGKWDW
ncbi:MAG: hypothetical protein AB8B56_13855, partial [Crocinitomicaceae bacterium]